MEVIDVGTTSVDEVLDLLFEGDNLRSLIGWHGAACFVLVRSVVAPGFYRRLIENSDTIDATTRQHVAFIVFHGDRSGVVYEAGTSYRPHLARRRLAGLSVTGDGYFRSDAMQSPTRDTIPSFARELAEQLRYSPENVNYPALSHHMTRAATRLMERYGVRESALPCLLFVDGNSPTESLVVQLDPADPLRSLYVDVLSPLSDELAQLSDFWKCRDTVASSKDDRNRAEKAVAELPGDVAALEKKYLAFRKQYAEYHHRAHQEWIPWLERFRSLLGPTLHVSEITAAIENLPEGYGIGRRELEDQVGQMLRVACLLQQAGVIEATASNTKPEVLGTADWTDRQRKSLARRMCKLKGKLTKTQKEVERSIAYWNKFFADLDLKTQKAHSDLSEARDYLASHSAQELQILAEDASLREKRLRERGYDDPVLTATQPSAFSALQSMFRQGLLGRESQSPTRRGKTTMRILFMAANPTMTTPLDLEEELRSLELELRGVKYRDQISFTARHAVRPDDLLRHVRSEQPTVIHFSGHGSAKGIVLRSDDGGCTEVTGPSLRRFLDGRGVELLVLNACYTKGQADHVAGAVSAVVGTTSEVHDEAARRFTVAFYRALGDGLSIREAFRDGGDAVVLYNLDDVFWSSGELDSIPLGPSEA